MAVLLAGLVLAGCGEKSSQPATPTETKSVKVTTPDTTKVKNEALAGTKANLERVGAYCIKGSPFSNSIVQTIQAAITRRQDKDIQESGYWVQLGHSMAGEGIIVDGNVTNNLPLKPKGFLTLPMDTQNSIIQHGDFSGFLLTTNKDLIVPGAQFYDRVFKGKEDLTRYKITDSWPPRGTPMPVKPAPYVEATNGSGSSPLFPKPNP